MKSYHLVIFLFLFGCKDNLTINQITFNNEIMYKVMIEGHINKPGLYLAAKNKLVSELINEAGGYKTNAQTIKDFKISDNEKIFINSMRIKNKINLNTANTQELETVKGIGPKKSLAIIEYRQKYGNFKSVSELKLIKGIKDKIFLKIYEYFTT